MTLICLVLLTMLSVALTKAQVTETFFVDPCGNGSVSHSQTPYHAVDDVNEAVCTVQCAADGSCAAFSHPPCVLHSTEHSLTCCAQHDNHTFVKQVVNKPL